MEAVVGEASIQVSGGENRFDERLLPLIRKHPAVVALHPVLSVSANVKMGTSQNQSLHILGLDVLEFANENGVTFLLAKNQKR